MHILCYTLVSLSSFLLFVITFLWDLCNGWDFHTNSIKFYLGEALTLIVAILATALAIHIGNKLDAAEEAEHTV